MENKRYILLLICLSGFLGQSLAQCYVEDDILVYLKCEHLTDADLPIQGFSGQYDAVFLENTEITQLQENCFPGISTLQVVISNNLKLAEVEPGFLGSMSASLKSLAFTNNPNLGDNLDFDQLEEFGELEVFDYVENNLGILKSDIKWPKKIRKIELILNPIEIIEANAFTNAVELDTVVMVHLSSANLSVNTHGFYTTSPTPPNLFLSGPNDLDLEEDAFGNIAGGKLWNSLAISTSDFPEDVFRLMLKTHFDKGHDSLMETNYGMARVADCESCDIAWLYKDARRFGLEQYRNLIGLNNVVCPGNIGSVLFTEDPDFIRLMESCEETDMPWPDDAYEACEAVSNPNQDDAADPANCHCFYLCAGGLPHGHECCQPGLAFNPDILTCDWAYNVPNCD